MNTENNIKSSEKIDLTAIWNKYKPFWWVFLISIIGCVGLSLLYLKIKSPMFLTKTMVMVNQDEEESAGAVGGLGALMSSFSIGSGSGSNVEDEMLKMSSHTNMTSVIKHLELNKTYWSKPGLFDRKIWYYGNSPLKVVIPDAVLDTISVTTTFKLDIPKDGKNISLKVKQGKEGTILKTNFDKFPYIVKTPYGTFTIDTTKYFVKGERLNFNASICNPSVTIEDINERIAINQVSKKANAILIDLEDANIDRAQDFLNTLVASYNERGIADKNEQALSTSKFIEERLIQLYKDLEDAETKIEDYKSQNQIVDATAEAEYTFVRKERIEAGMLEMETQAAVLQMIKDFLSSPENKYNLVPFTTDFPEEPITAYNELVLQRLKLESTTKENNVALKSLTTQVDAMRKNVIATIEKQLQSTRIALADMRREASSAEQRMTGIPRMERELTALYRDQVIKNEIYGYLLQKREENQLKLMRNTPKGKVIDVAHTDIKPVSPNKIVVPALGLIFGVGGGFVISNFIESRRNRRNKKSTKSIEE